MKKIHIVLLSYLIVGVALFSLVCIASPTDIHGHFKTPNYARLAISYYNEAELIHTENTDRFFVDFLLSADNNLYVITIKKHDTIWGNTYDRWDTTAFYTDIKAKECETHLSENGELPWELASIGSNVYWSVLEQTNEVIVQQAKKIDFFIGNKPFALYIRE